MLVPAEILTVVRTEEGPAVLVRPFSMDRALPILIGPYEAQSIILGQTSILSQTMSVTRPMTHDLMINVVQALEARIEQVEIYTLKEKIYYANLIVVDSRGERKIIDSRPSDALALAIRVRCPILIENSLVEEEGIDTVQLALSSLEESEVSLSNYSQDEDEEDREEDQPEDQVSGRETEPEEEISDQPSLESLSREELQLRLEYCLENELYEEAAKIRDLLKKFD